MPFQKIYFTEEERLAALARNTKRWRERHPEKAKGYDAHLRRKLGKSEEEYVAQLEKQGGRCALCGRSSNNRHTKKMYWDHDHETGKARGLLCSRCNSGIGFFGDSIEMLLKAVEYLKSYE